MGEVVAEPPTSGKWGKWWRSPQRRANGGSGGGAPSVGRIGEVAAEPPA